MLDVHSTGILNSLKIYISLFLQSIYIPNSSRRLTNTSNNDKIYF